LPERIKIKVDGRKQPCQIRKVARAAGIDRQLQYAVKYYGDFAISGSFVIKVDTMPLVSIIIPTYNRLDRLKQVLVGLERQSYALNNFEVVVVSDGSSDGTDAYLSSWTTQLSLIVVTQTNRGVAAARNHGIQHATGDLILFLDDDVVPAPQLIVEHIRIHAEHSKDVIVLGPMLTPDDFALSPWVRWEQAMLTKQYRAMLNGEFEPTARQFYTGNTSLARAHLLSSGGFDESFRRAEDVELAYRLAERGLQFVFNPVAIGYHYAERSFRSWMEIPYVYGRNDVIFTRDKHQDWLLPKVFNEFHDRNMLVQLLVKVCLDRDALSKSTVAWLKGISYLADRLGLERLVQTTHSGMFNLRYYQGIAHEIGGRRRFFAQLEQTHV
jgi:glycosyltransferase involved in cell wall biosynthesis